MTVKKRTNKVNQINHHTAAACVEKQTKKQRQKIPQVMLDRTV